MKNTAAEFSIDIIKGDLKDIATASDVVLQRIRAVRAVLSPHIVSPDKDRYDELVSAAVVISDTLLGVIKLDFPVIKNHIGNANANLNNLPKLIEPENKEEVKKNDTEA